jgi:hypothetical protein
VVAILEHHRARLEIDTAPLKGTTFRVWFPAAAAAEERRSGGAEEDRLRAAGDRASGVPAE